MADTEYGVNANEAVKLWGRKLFRESLKATFAYKFMGDSTSSVLQIKDETSKGPGDTVYNTLRMQLSGDGVEGDGVLEGKEESLTTYRDTLVINQLRHAVRSKGKMTEQRVPFSIREEARQGLQDWWADRFDTVFFNQLCGNNAVSDSKYLGHNTVTAPDTGHHWWGDTTSADENLSSTSTGILSFALIDKLIAKAKTASPVLRPIMIGNEPHYVMFVHPDQAYDLRTDTTSGNFLDIQKAAIQGGKISKNPIFTGALGMYNGVILHESTRLPKGVNSTTAAAVDNTRRAVLCGAQAACVAFGRGNGNAKMSWDEEMFDYGNKLGVSAGMVWGLKRSIFNSLTFGSFVLSTYTTLNS